MREGCAQYCAYWGNIQALLSKGETFILSKVGLQDFYDNNFPLIFLTVILSEHFRNFVFPYPLRQGNPTSFSQLMPTFIIFFVSSRNRLQTMTFSPETFGTIKYTTWNTYANFFLHLYRVNHCKPENLNYFFFSFSSHPSPSSPQLLDQGIARCGSWG